MCSAWFSSKISFWSKSSTFSFVQRTLLQRSCSLLSYIVANMYICTKDDCETVSTHSWTFNTSKLSKISSFKVVQNFFKGLHEHFLFHRNWVWKLLHSGCNFCSSPFSLMLIHRWFCLTMAQHHTCSNQTFFSVNLVFWIHSCLVLFFRNTNLNSWPHLLTVKVMSRLRSHVIHIWFTSIICY